MRKPSITIIAAACGIVCLANWRLWQRDRALAERLQATQTPTPVLEHTPQVSVLVAAWNEGPQVATHIRSFLALRYPAIELIICAGGTDDTYAHAAAFSGPRVTVLRQAAGEGKQRALARCLKHATGTIIYLIDADCGYSDSALLHLLEPLVLAGEAVVTGTIRPLDSQIQALLPQHLWAANLVSDAHRSVVGTGLLGCNAALTRGAIEQIGGLDFPAPTGTDYQLAQRLLRAGIPIRFVRESVVPTLYAASFGSYCRRQSRWLRNLMLYGPTYGAQHDVVAALRTIAIGVGMLLLPIGGLFFTPLLLLWLLLFLHGTLARLRHVGFSALLQRRRPGLKLLAALPFLTLTDIVAWALPLVDLLNTQRRSQW